MVAAMLKSQGTQNTSPPGETAQTFRPYVEIPGRDAVGLVLLCDHASNALPREYGTLGLPESELARHIAYDIGAAGVTRTLAQHLEAPAVLSQFSRLLIDPNRGTDDPTLIMRLSDGAIIPGNIDVDERERQRRLARFYHPYHKAIDAAIDRAMAQGKPPALLSIHSFTDRWKDAARPWHVTVLFDRDVRLARPLVEALRAEGGLVVGENVPYSGGLEGDCMYQHGTRRGLAHALIEIRQDLIRDPAGQRAWGERLARIMARLLADATLSPRLHEIAMTPQVSQDVPDVCDVQTRDP